MIIMLIYFLMDNSLDTKVALITGITGQDGSFLARYLLDLNYHIVAPTRISPDKSNLNKLGISNHPNINFIAYTIWSDFDDIITQYKPHEIYHLAAMSHVGKSHQNPGLVFDVNTTWTIQLLKFILKNSPTSKLFFASSCEIFKNNLESKVTEEGITQPTNPYGISKLAAHSMVSYYRNVKNLFACNGILFNHESELRTEDFVSKKICKEVARIVKHGGKPLMLGNIEAKKDWGYAPDYVQSFHSMLQRETANDYIISTGKLHSVKDMVNSAFESLDYKITWSGDGINTHAVDETGKIRVAINKKYFRPLDNRFLCGNNQKAKDYLNLSYLTPFKEWVKKMSLLEYKEL